MFSQSSVHPQCLDSFQVCLFVSDRLFRLAKQEKKSSSSKFNLNLFTFAPLKFANKKKHKNVSENNCTAQKKKIKERRQNRLRSGASTRWAIKQLKSKRESRKFTLTDAHAVRNYSFRIKFDSRD